jgi:hypothetical protein
VTTKFTLYDGHERRYGKGKQAETLDCLSCNGPIRYPFYAVRWHGRNVYYRHAECFERDENVPEPPGEPIREGPWPL